MQSWRLLFQRAQIISFLSLHWTCAEQRLLWSILFKHCVRILIRPISLVSLQMPLKTIAINSWAPTHSETDETNFVGWSFPVLGKVPRNLPGWLRETVIHLHRQWSPGKQCEKPLEFDWSRTRAKCRTDQSKRWRFRGGHSLLERHNRCSEGSYAD